jgi:hypothetical protein
MSHGFEAMLLRWAETSNGGATIVLQLSDPGDLEHFKRLTLAKKPSKKGEGMAGQRLMVGVAEIGDDEKPVQPLNSPLKGGPLARLAGMWCAEPLFQTWLFKTFCAKGVTHEGEETEMASALIRSICGIESRAELDNNAQAREHFDTLIRIPYAAYRAQHSPQTTQEQD